MSTSRRTFLKTSALAAAGTVLPARSWANVLGANDDIRVAVIGLNGRGMNHVSSLARISGVRIVALCDPDTAVLEQAKNARNLPDAKRYTRHPQAARRQGHRRRHDRDAEPLAFARRRSGRAGGQGRVRREARLAQRLGRPPARRARRSKYNRIVQTGTQIRSSAGTARGGRSGSRRAISARSPWRAASATSAATASARPTGPQPIPATVDYDLWCGPAPLVAPHRNAARRLVHYDWHWVWHYGNGDLGNQGIHQMDVARWFLGETELPPRIAELRRPPRLRGRRRHAEHADRHPRLRDGAADLRGARPARRRPGSPAGRRPRGQPGRRRERHGQVPRRRHRQRHRLRGRQPRHARSTSTPRRTTRPARS